MHCFVYPKYGLCEVRSPKLTNEKPDTLVYRPELPNYRNTRRKLSDDCTQLLFTTVDDNNKRIFLAELYKKVKRKHLVRQLILRQSTAGQMVRSSMKEINHAINRK